MIVERSLCVSYSVVAVIAAVCEVSTSEEMRFLDTHWPEFCQRNGSAIAIVVELYWSVLYGRPMPIP